MARELHDTLAHTLSGLSVQLEATQAYWEADPDTARELLGRSLSATRLGLDDTRRALKALRASPLDDLGLLMALQRLAESAAERDRPKGAVELPDPGTLRHHLGADRVRHRLSRGGARLHCRPGPFRTPAGRR